MPCTSSLPLRRLVGSMKDESPCSRNSRIPSTVLTVVSTHVQSQHWKAQSKKTEACGCTGGQRTPLPVRQTAAWREKNEPCLPETAFVGLQTALPMRKQVAWERTLRNMGRS